MMTLPKSLSIKAYFTKITILFMLKKIYTNALKIKKKNLKSSIYIQILFSKVFFNSKDSISPQNNHLQKGSLQQSTIEQQFVIKNQAKQIYNQSLSKERHINPQTRKKALQRSINDSYQIISNIEEHQQTNKDNEDTSRIRIKSKEWKQDMKLPLNWQDTVQFYSKYLTDQEKEEIKQFQKIYYIGHKCSKMERDKLGINDGFDNSKGEYIVQVLDHIAYRYEIIKILGEGSFGQVFQVFDHKKLQFFALKIIRNKKKYQNQAQIELNILLYIKELDSDNLISIVKIQDYTYFRNHLCLSFEILSSNLYELIKLNDYNGLPLDLIRKFAIQILNSLLFLKKLNVVHCDLKPENVLLKTWNKSGIKIVDFGSSCFENERIYTYIQSRYYRAPEVILGLPYGHPIDMWSFACIIAELQMGYPIFPGENELEQMAYIMELIGPPELHFIEKAPRKKYYFDSINQPRLYKSKKGKIRIPNSKTFSKVLETKDHDFIDFLQNCFVWEPEKRMKPLQGLLHPWILNGLPTEIRKKHIEFLLFESQQENELKQDGSTPSGMEEGTLQKITKEINLLDTMKQKLKTVPDQLNFSSKDSNIESQKTNSKFYCNGGHILKSDFL